MGSLIIIPATTGMYLGRSLWSMQMIAVGSAMGSTLIGTVLASRRGGGTAPGPLIIVVAASVFVVSLFGRRRSVQRR